MEKKYKIMIISLCAIAVALIVVIVLAMTIKTEKMPEKANVKYEEFTPPQFDSDAEKGVPNAPKELGYTQVYKEGMPYKAGVCGELKLHDEKYADVYFANLEENDMWLKLRILDVNGNILAETGLIKPGEYIKTIEFTEIPNIGDSVKLKIMSYEPNTYYSCGAVTLNTKIGG